MLCAPAMKKKIMCIVCVCDCLDITIATAVTADHVSSNFKGARARSIVIIPVIA